MHILRIDYKTGLRIDFGFLEKGPAREAVEAINTAKPGALVTIIDDHGHEGTLRVDGVLAVVLTDLAAEVSGQMDVQAAIEAEKARNGAIPSARFPQQGILQQGIPVQAVGDRPAFSS
jgi:hypothetical protein